MSVDALHIELPRATGRRMSVLIAVGLCSCIADIALIVAGLRGLLPVPVLLLLHLSLAPLAGAAAWRSDTSLAALAAISIMVFGPLGALATALMAAMLAARKRGNQALSADWEDALALPATADLSERLADAIVDGRLPRPGTTVVASFPDISRNGSVAQRQTMLGLMSQEYHPSFAPVLRRELTSDEAAVRVSAAAVFSKLRDRNRQLMNSAGPLPDILSPDLALVRGLALARGIASGLLDQSDVPAARAESIDLLLTGRPNATHPDETEEMLAILLFEAGQDDVLDDRLSGLDLGGSATLRSIRTRSLMRSGRLSEAAEIVRSAQAVAPLDLSARAKRPLLSSRVGGGR